jgi:hypothetical protein
MTNECVCACQGLLSEDSVSIIHLCSDNVGITCLCCDCQHSIWTFSQPCYWTFKFSGMLWSAIGYAVPSVWRFVVPSKYQNYTLYDTASYLKRLLIFNVAHLRIFTSAISASLFITEWTSSMYQCLPVMCSSCLFLYFSVYSKIYLFLVYYMAWSGNIPEHRAHRHHGRSLKSHPIYSIRTSCFTRFHSHSLHSTSSDDHSLLSHRIDDCAVCICENVYKETLSDWVIPEITKRFWLHSLLWQVPTNSNLKANAHIIKFRLLEHFLRNLSLHMIFLWLLMHA